MLETSEFNQKNKSSINLASKTDYYYSLSVAFTVLLILSNLGATKIMNFFGLALDGGTILFPFLYIISDILTEIYGFSASRKVIWTAFFYNCVFCIFIYILIALPPFEYWNGQSSFEEIFATSPRIILASLFSYLLGEFLNTCIISYGKIRFSGKCFALRAIFSTFLGSLLESILFGCIAFYGSIPIDELGKMILLLTLIKIIYEIIFMPITLRIIVFLKQKEGIDVFEKPSFTALFPKLF